jgi:Golgi apyrase
MQANAYAGISSFADNPEGVAAYLAPLLAHARAHIPPSLEATTPIFLYATAGMRLLAPEQQGRVLRAACGALKDGARFRLAAASRDGPCGASVRIITGEEEGLFGWLAVNYLMDGFAGANRTTFGFLDMGGASTQIAFEPSAAERARTQNLLVPVRLRLLGGAEIRHDVFVTTWLGYGTNQARERYVAAAVDAFEALPAHNDTRVPDPCLPVALERTETPLHLGPAPPHAARAHTLVGTGSFGGCLRATAPLLRKDAPCPADAHCLMNGAPGPAIDFSVSRFIGVSEYWYAAQDAFGLGGAYDFAQYERAAQAFCAREWADVQRAHAAHEPGEHWAQPGTAATLPRLELQCFKAAWIVNVLHEGLGMPRLVDAHGSGEPVAGGDKAAAAAASKALFTSADAVGDVAISWTLGKMVLEASKQVAPADRAAAPLGEPLDAAPPAVPPPIRPEEDMQAPGLDWPALPLPGALPRTPAPLSWLFYAAVVLALLFFLRRARMLPWRRLRRGADFAESGFAMEEGHASTFRAPLRPAPLRRTASSATPGASTPPTPRSPSYSTAYAGGGASAQALASSLSSLARARGANGSAASLAARPLSRAGSGPA